MGENHRGGLKRRLKSDTDARYYKIMYEYDFGIGTSPDNSAWLNSEFVKATMKDEDGNVRGYEI